MLFNEIKTPMGIASLGHAYVDSVLGPVQRGEDAGIPGFVIFNSLPEGSEIPDALAEIFGQALIDALNRGYKKHLDLALIRAIPQPPPITERERSMLDRVADALRDYELERAERCVMFAIAQCSLGKQENGTYRLFPTGIKAAIKYSGYSASAFYKAARALEGYGWLSIGGAERNWTHIDLDIANLEGVSEEG